MGLGVRAKPGVGIVVYSIAPGLQADKEGMDPGCKVRAHAHRRVGCPQYTPFFNFFLKKCL
jgi:hypothetical protein